MLTVALLLGMAGRALLTATPWGLNLPLWVGSLAGAVVVLGARNRVRLHRSGWVWLGLVLLFAAAVAWRDSGTLRFLNVVAMMTALALAAEGFREPRPGGCGVLEYLGRLGLAGVHAVGGLPALLFSDVRWRQVAPGVGGFLGPAVRGAVLAAPLLLVFGLLFASADPVFARAAERLLDWRLDALLPPVLWTLFWAWLAAGVLRQCLWDGKRLALAVRWPPEPSGARRQRVGDLELAIVLGLLNALFAAFLLVQFRYLFGGGALVERSLGLTYAEYARRGFFELVAVAALLLPVLLALSALGARDGDRTEMRVRALSGVLIAQVFVILFSAAERMRLYTAEYGLTELRFYTSAFMAWLAVLLVWFAATVLRGRRARFMGGAAVAGLATLLVLNAVNPDARIAAANLGRSSAERPTDIGYLTSLSGDAVPVLAAAAPRLSPAARCAALRGVHAGAWNDEDRDWRSWNRGRARARAIARLGGDLPPASACGGRDGPGR